MPVVFLLLLLLAFSAPAQPYFQQEVNYNIAVRLDDVRHQLHGQADINYINHSPDTLRFLYFHIWPQAYSSNKTELARQLIKLGNTSLYFADASQRGDMDSLAFQLDGLPCVWRPDSTNPDVVKIFLERPLLPGNRVLVSTPFRVSIPSGEISRLGHEEQSYQITQWYPKPAVYDTSGWHPMPYLHIGEFYSEYGAFDVSITLPANYVVGATGNLQTASEREFLAAKASETGQWLAAREAKNDWSNFKTDTFPASSNETKTLRYTEQNVHDFAWFADKNFLVSFQRMVQDGDDKPVELWALYTPKNAKRWRYSTLYMADAIRYYGQWNGKYAYSQATAVDGALSAGGGMEYPTITVIGNAVSDLSLETVIMHELGHNWFYGMLGSDERESPWLDEGLNSYNEMRYLATKYPAGSLWHKQQARGLQRFVGMGDFRNDHSHYIQYLLAARVGSDQRLNDVSTAYSDFNYALSVYSKPAVFLNYLRHYLGDERMDKAMQAYFNQNQFKHPNVDALRSALESSTGKNLSWLFDEVVPTRSRLDYAVVGRRKKDDESYFKLRNRGGVSGPVHITTVSETGEYCEVWIEGFAGDTLISFDAANTELLKIDAGRIMPEVNAENNLWVNRPLFKKIEPIRLRLVGGLERPFYNDLALLPLVGFSAERGFIPGLAAHNLSVPTRPFTYMVAPMWATRNSTMAGFVSLSYQVVPEFAAFEAVEFGLDGRTTDTASIEFIDQFARLSPSITAHFRPSNYQGVFRHKLKLSTILLWGRTYIGGFTGNIPFHTLTYYNRIDYLPRWNHPLYATLANVRFEQSNNILRTSLEIETTVKSLPKLVQHIRFFAGAFVINNSLSGVHNFRMDGQNAATDYALDAIIFNRSANFTASQFAVTHGGFKVYAPAGQSDKWIAAFNYKVRYKKFFLGLYADVGLNPLLDPLANAGIAAIIIPQVFEIYWPLVYTKNVDLSLEANGMEGLELIRFQLNLNKLNPLPYVRRSEIPRF